MIDLNKIKSTYFMDENTVKKLLALFCESAQTDLKNLESHIATLEFEQIHNSSHKLKAGVRYFFLDGLSTRLEQMQHAAKNRDAQLIHNLFDEIKPGFNQVIADLKKILL